MNAQGEAVGTGDGGIVLALRGVAVHAGERRLLGPIDLALCAGETVGLVGESGSGKSLTIAALLGLLPAGLQASGALHLAPLPAGDKVEFGVTVKIRLRGTEKTFRIVGDDEADPAAGLLSFNAPLARAMLGAEPGDLLPFAGEDDAIEIVAIAVPADGPMR